MNQSTEPLVWGRSPYRAQLELFIVVALIVTVFELTILFGFQHLNPLVVSAAMALGSILGGLITAYCIGWWLFWPLHRGNVSLWRTFDDLLCSSLLVLSIAGIFIEDFKIFAMSANVAIALRILYDLVMSYSEKGDLSPDASENEENLGI